MSWREKWLPVATVLIAAGTVIVSVWLSSRSQTERARNDLILAAAEVVMAQPTCPLSQARARQLVRVFPSLTKPLSSLTTHPLSADLCKQLKRSRGIGSNITVSPGGFVFPFPRTSTAPTLTITNPFVRPPKTAVPGRTTPRQRTTTTTG